MLSWLTDLLLVGTLVLAVASLGYVIADRLIDDAILLIAGVLEVGLLAQLVNGVVSGATRGGGWERTVFFAYLVATPLVPPGAVFLALKEKSRWGMGIVLLSAATVAVLLVRLGQLWGTGA